MEVLIEWAHGRRRSEKLKKALQLVEPLIGRNTADIADLSREAMAEHERRGEVIGTIDLNPRRRR